MVTQVMIYFMAERMRTSCTGGSGNDTLYGQGGGDTYMFSVGSGVDTVIDYSADGTTDVVQFTDVASTGLTGLIRSGNDLLLRYGAGDQVTASQLLR